MLFTELKKIKEEDIQTALMTQMQARGLDPTILQQKLCDKLTVEELISDIVEELIDEAATANRESFRARQRQGFEQAQANGKQVGRPTRKSPESFEQVRRMYETHEISGAQAAQLLGVARGTFYRWLKENPKKSGGGHINNKKCLKCLFISRKSYKKVESIFRLHFFIIVFLRILCVWILLRLLRLQLFRDLCADKITDSGTEKAGQHRAFQFNTGYHTENTAKNQTTAIAKDNAPKGEPGNAKNLLFMQGENGFFCFLCGYLWGFCGQYAGFFLLQICILVHKFQSFQGKILCDLFLLYHKQR